MMQNSASALGKPLIVNQLSHHQVQASALLSFALEPGEVSILKGPSGVGKSSLFRILTQSLEAESGDFSVHGVKCSLEKGRFLNRKTQLANLNMAYVPQHSLPFQGLSAKAQLQFVRFFSKRRVNKGVNDKEHLQQVLECLELSDALLSKPVSAFSGGQLARFSMARALVSQPRSLLIDESLGRLEFRLASQILNHLKAHVKVTNGFVLLSSHQDSLNELVEHSVSLKESSTLLS